MSAKAWKILDIDSINICLLYTSDATLKEDKKDGYVIVKEDLGTTVDEEAFWKKLQDSVLNLSLIHI